MATKKNNSSDRENDLKKELNNASSPVDNKPIEEKLKDAAGSITRAADDSKLRDDELARRRKEEAKEKRAKEKEAEKQKRAAEKEDKKQT